MVNPLTPENAKGWLGVLLPIIQQASGLTVIILGLCAYYVIAGQQRELERSQTVSLELFHKLEAAYVAQLELARNCPPKHD